MEIPVTTITKEEYVKAVTAADELYKKSTESILHGMTSLGTLLSYVHRAGFAHITLDDLYYWNWGFGGDV